ncbi:MAG: hypothetical protein HQK63_15410 [Desulfamplus sp.]|nr:hypothetical protein [Desulfamplus sp.]
MKTRFVILSMFLMLVLFFSISSCRNSGVPFVAGAVVGAVVADTVISNRHEHNRNRCYETVNGEWRQGRYGRTYWHRFSHPKRVEVPCD